jgi:F-type H+-transporting ATPase subunit b
MHGIFSTAEFWQAVSFALFVIATYRPVKLIILEALDKRSERIRHNVEEMDKLILEVGLSLEQVKSKYDNIDSELEVIERNTAREIDLLQKTFEKEVTQYIHQKTKQLVEKIAADERKALEKLRIDSVNSAIVVAEQYITQAMNQDILNEQLKNSMHLLGTKLKHN